MFPHWWLSKGEGARGPLWERSKYNSFLIFWRRTFDVFIVPRSWLVSCTYWQATYSFETSCFSIHVFKEIISFRWRNVRAAYFSMSNKKLWSSDCWSAERPADEWTTTKRPSANALKPLLIIPTPFLRILRKRRSWRGWVPNMPASVRSKEVFLMFFVFKSSSYWSTSHWCFCIYKFCLQACLWNRMAEINFNLFIFRSTHPAVWKIFTGKWRRP